MRSMRHYIYTILEVAPEKKGPSWFFDVSLTTLIILNIAALILESVPEYEARYGEAFYYFELFSVIVFSAEYVLRLWAAVEDERFRHPFWGRVRYFFTPLALIDLLAVLPFFLAMWIVDLRFLRILRLFRLLRLFKFVRYVKALDAIGEVIRDRWEQLVISIVFMFFMLLLVSCAMYYVEHDAQPDKFASIPDTMWWGVATLTTVGYGDVYPITPLGKLLGGGIAILGVGLFALPAGILASGFSEALDQHKKPKPGQERCPHCGQAMPKSS
ncbi:MAG: ion transporter [Lewinella sp.]|nr:ion transporter [Lewinella sp.]